MAITYTGTSTGGVFSINVNGSDLAADSNVHASVTTTDAAGNEATATDEHGRDVSTATVVYDANATDDDATAPNNTITYSLSGDDAGLFNIDTSTGEVTFIASPDFETRRSRRRQRLRGYGPRQ